jgi:AraC-like DNA-binding protein
VGGRACEVDDGDWLLCRAGTEYGHSDRPFAPGQIVYFQFHHPSATGATFPLPLHGKLGPHFRELWHESLGVVGDARSSDELLRQAAAAGLQRILLRLAGLGHQGLLAQDGSAAVTRVEIAVEEVARFYRSYLIEPLSLAVLAERYGLSSDHLSRCFRRRYGLTPAQYRLKCQMEEADTLIRKSVLSFTAVAHQCGFHDPHHFNKRIRQYFKKTPSEMRGEDVVSTR